MTGITLEEAVAKRSSWVSNVFGWLASKAGYDLVPLDAFGHDPFRDIRQLSERENLSVRTFFDVGANEGGTSLKVTKQFPEARIFAFEPHPNTFARLKDATREYTAIEAVQVALGAEAGDRIMHTYENSLLNSLLPNAQFPVRFGQVSSPPMQVRCTTVDVLCTERGIKKIDVLKIDTEGFDLEVLKGAQTMLDQGAISFIYFEFNDVQVSSENAAGGALFPIDEFLRRYQYRFIATYNDYVVTAGDLFAVSNALYCRQNLTA